MAEQVKTPETPETHVPTPTVPDTAPEQPPTVDEPVVVPITDPVIHTPIDALEEPVIPEPLPPIILDAVDLEKKERAGRHIAGNTLPQFNALGSLYEPDDLKFLFYSTPPELSEKVKKTIKDNKKAISDLTNTVGNVNTTVFTNIDDIRANKEQLARTTTKATTNRTLISNMESLLNTTRSDVQTNKTNISNVKSTLKTRADTIEQTGILNADVMLKNKKRIGDLETSLSSVQLDILPQMISNTSENEQKIKDNVAKLKAAKLRVNNIESDVSANRTRSKNTVTKVDNIVDTTIPNLVTNIGTYDTRIDTNTGNITLNKTAIGQVQSIVADNATEIADFSKDLNDIRDIADKAERDTENQTTIVRNVKIKMDEVERGQENVETEVLTIQSTARQLNTKVSDNITAISDLVAEDTTIKRDVDDIVADITQLQSNTSIIFNERYRNILDELQGTAPDVFYTSIAKHNNSWTMDWSDDTKMLSNIRVDTAGTTFEVLSSGYYKILLFDGVSTKGTGGTLIIAPTTGQTEADFTFLYTELGIDKWVNKFVLPNTFGGWESISCIVDLYPLKAGAKFTISVDYPTDAYSDGSYYADSSGFDGLDYGRLTITKIHNVFTPIEEDPDVNA